MTGWRYRARAAALVVVALAAGVATVMPAAAAPDQYAPSIGTATGLLQTGPTNVPLGVRSSGACPAGTTVVNGFLNSAAAGITDGIAISTNSTDVATLPTTGMPLDNNLVGLAQSAGRVLVDGRYELSVVCYPDPFSNPSAQFDAEFTVSGAPGPGAAGTTVTWDVDGADPTTTTLSVAPEGTATVGEAVTLTARVTPATAAGTVRFTDTAGGAGVDLGDAAVAGGVASLTTTTLAAGGHALVATFVPASTTFLGSSSAPVPYAVLTQGQSPTTTTLAASPSGSAVQGAPVTLTATVSPAAAAGTVAFADGGTPLGAAPVTGGVATLTTAALEVGSRSLTAAFTPTDAAAYAPSVSAALAYGITPSGGSGSTWLGLLAIDGARGTATQPITLKAPQPCPAGADSVSVSLSGPGGWSGGVPVPSQGGFFEPGQAVVASPPAEVAGLNGLTIVPGAYSFVVTCRETFGDRTFGFYAGPLWFYDSLNWLAEDPAKVGIPSDTTVTVSPAGRAEVGKAVTLVATVTPASAGGTVRFQSESNGDVTSLGSAAVKDGQARVTTNQLAFGLYYVTAVFTPAAATPPYNASTSGESVFAMTKIIPPVPQGPAAIRGRPAVGGTVTCAATFRNATSLQYAWIRDRAAIPGATAAAYRVVAADKGHALRCRASATNAGGRTERISPAVRVSS